MEMVDVHHICLNGYFSIVMRVSFIVPIYKVQEYIGRCVKSITEQSYKDIEVILVDDGSPDDCPVICDKFALTDNRIKVIHKKNGGLSDARNTGLLHASGDYVVFIDGDDFWIGNDSLEKLMLDVENKKDCDFIGYNCSYYFPQNNSFKKWVYYSDKLNQPVDKNQAIVELVSSGTFPMSACLKIIKRDFLIENELFFKVGQLAEDIPWFINVLDACKKCSFINQYIYAYRQGVAGSITNSGGEKSFKNLLDIVETEVEKVEERSLNKEAIEALYSFFAYELSILMIYTKCSKEDKQRINKLSWLIEYDVNPKVRIIKKLKGVFGIGFTRILIRFYNMYRRSKR